MKHKIIIHPEDHKNARTSHQSSEKAGKKKMSFFGDRASRQFVRNEIIKDGLEMAEAFAKDDETPSNVRSRNFKM